MLLTPLSLSKSIPVREAFPHLTKLEIKAMTQKIVNGGTRLELTKAATEALEAWGKMGVARRGLAMSEGLKGLLRSPGAKVGYALTAITTGYAMWEGAHGRGVGAERHETSGLRGAVYQGSYDLFLGEWVEGAAQAPANAVNRSWIDFDKQQNRKMYTRQGFMWDAGGRLVNEGK
jgi:hypothetical protein